MEVGKLEELESWKKKVGATTGHPYFLTFTIHYSLLTIHYHLSSICPEILLGISVLDPLLMKVVQDPIWISKDLTT